MWRCPKCSKIYDGDSRICRECGAILEEVSEVEEVAPATDDTALEPEIEEALFAPAPAHDAAEDLDNDKPPVANSMPWRCVRCLEDVPGNFEVCWNCGADRQGALAADASPSPVADASEPPVTAEIAEPLELGACPECQAIAVMPDLRLVSDSAPHLEMKVAAYGRPHALIFKDPFFGTLRADVCGECGHVRFYVVNPEQLYGKYIQSREMQ